MQRRLRERLLEHDAVVDAARGGLFAVDRFDSWAGDDPGQIALTRMPSPPSSIDSDLVKPITAHLDAEYGERNGKPKRPAADDRLTMLGFLLRRNAGSRAVRNGTAR